MPRIFSKHLWVCSQEKPEGIPSCSASGSYLLLELFRAEISKAGLAEEILVTACGCLEICERGPNVVVCPEGHWYTGVKPEDVKDIVQQHLVNDKPLEERDESDPVTIRAEITAHRDKLHKMMAARARAGVLPDELSDLLQGFQWSRVLLTAIELNLFTVVGRGATAEDVAQKIGTDKRATTSLMNALVALRLLDKNDGRYSNGEWAKTFLSEGAPHDSRAALMHTVHQWPRWSTLTECIRTGTAVTYEEMVERGREEWTDPFIAAMHKNASFQAPVVVDALDLDGVNRLLDLGGGSGAYSIAFARARPNITATVFDLPTVTPLTRHYVDESGVANRIRTVDGDLRTDSYGHDFDLVFISAICHMNGPEENREMLRKAKDALRAGGQVVIQDFLLHDDKSGPQFATLFALNMLVGTKYGSSYSGLEYKSWLKDLGFVDIQKTELPGPADLIVGSKPDAAKR